MNIDDWKSQIKRGTLEFCILLMIKQRPSYGYEIITELNNNGAAVLGYAKEGTVYPILYRLQEADLIQCRIAPAAANGGSKKYYSLTTKGHETLKELIFFWQKYTDCVNNFIGDSQQVEASK